MRNLKTNTLKRIHQIIRGNYYVFEINSRINIDFGITRLNTYSTASKSLRLDPNDVNKMHRDDFTTKDGVILNSEKLGQISQKINDGKTLAIDDTYDFDPLEEEEYEVYPLSQKYDKSLSTRKLRIRGCLMLIIIISITLLFVDILKGNIFSNSPIRLGFYSDKITKINIPLKEVDKFEFNTKNCVVYIIETNPSQLVPPSNSQIYISAGRNTEIDLNRNNETQLINIVSEIDSVGCYIEFRVPGNTNLSKLSFNYYGDRISDLILTDHKKESEWNSPLTIKDLSVRIKDANPYIHFNSSHNIESLNIFGGYCNCNFDTVKIENMNFKVNSGVLVVKQHESYKTNRVSVKTPTGNHCLSGGKVNQQSTLCSSEATTLSELKSMSTENYCSTSGYVCSSEIVACPTFNSPLIQSQGSFNILLKDGPVQFTIDGSKPITNVSFYNSKDSFNFASQKVLEQNKENFGSEPLDPRIYIYEIIGPNYSKTWVHSSMKQYIEARPWLLSILSLSILRPKYFRDTLIHIPGGVCPSQSMDPILKDAQIGRLLEGQSFMGYGHMLSIKENNSYFEIAREIGGEYYKVEIPFLNNNYLIIISLIVSSLIAGYCVFIFTYTIIKVLRKLAKGHIAKISELRRFEFVKGFNRLGLKNNEKFNKILMLGICDAKPKKIVTEEEIIEEKKQREGEDIGITSLSFFQTIELYINWWVRSRTNSFYMFLMGVYPTDEGFKEVDDKSNLQNSSISLIELKRRYTEFCLKGGWVLRDIEKEKWLLEKFNLIIESKATTETEIFTFIRWKTPFEKFEENQNLVKHKDLEDLLEVEDEVSVMNLFLRSECKPSVLKGDYIRLQDMEKRYEEFCIQRSVKKTLQMNISSSVEIEKFGAKYENNFKLSYVKGISTRPIPCEAKEFRNVKDSYIPYLVRIKTLRNRNSWLNIFNYGITYSLTRKVLGIDGFITNVVTVIFHLMFLVMTPLALLLAV